MVDTINFYKNLKPVKDFNSLTDIKHFRKVPEDWYVIITDVKSSTKAIETGMYKTVNTVGALAIVAILNITKGYKIPFIFGGDGATLLIPHIFLEDAKAVLLDTAETSRLAFNLELRIGFVPIKYLYDNGVDLLLAKYEVTKDYSQAIGMGGGLSYAEDLVKSGRFNILNSYSQKLANFEGFECRWKDIPSTQGETISLIVYAIGDEKTVIYSEILNKIDEIYGKSEIRNPIKPQKLSLSMGKELMAESMVFNKNMLYLILYYMRLILSNILQIIILRKSLLNFKKKISENIDYQKFDDSLKMVMNGNKENSKELDKYLNKLYKENKIFYGIHKSDAALMTCLVFQKDGEQVHFVDSSNGGYALAAKKLKAQKKFKN